MAKKLLLVYPAPQLEWLKMSGLEMWAGPPLGLAYVAAATPDHWEIEIVDEYVDRIDLAADYDLVGISACTANATRGYQIGQAFRQRGVKVAMGGFHVSSCVDEALQHADAVVIGEAEPVWPQLLQDLERGQLQRTYAGGYPSLDGLPLPRRDLLSAKYRHDVIQTTRGCPFDCEFCAVTGFYGKRYNSYYAPRPRLRNALKTLVKTRSLFGAVYSYLLNRDCWRLYDFEALYRGAVAR